MKQRWATIEQPAGPASLPYANADETDHHRAVTYASYERFLRQHLQSLDAQRSAHWSRDYRNANAYLVSVQPMRERLKDMLGFWAPPNSRPTLRTYHETILHEDADFIATRKTLEVLPGLQTYLIEFTPTTHATKPSPGLIVQHGYGGTPERICGMTPNANDADYSYRSLGLRAVQRGFHVVAIHHPSGFGSQHETESSIPTHPQHGREYGKNRLHRLATLAGRTLFGLDLLCTSRAIDYLQTLSNVAPDQISIYGLSQGGQTALYLAAIDTRIKAAVCSAYFNNRLKKLIGPSRTTTYLDAREEDKFFSDIVRLFADPDLASLIVPRAFAIEAGIKDNSIDFIEASNAYTEAAVHYERLGISDRIEFIAHREGHVSATGRALEFLEEHLTSKIPAIDT